MCSFFIKKKLEYTLFAHKESSNNISHQQKGTVVDKLIEETLIDRNHLQELLSICEGNGIKNWCPLFSSPIETNDFSLRVPCSSKASRRDLSE